jgi:arylsulfatase A-like enzyme
MGGQASDRGRKPNVVLIFGDEWRGQATGYAGDPNCETPTLDTLARESIGFPNAVAGCPVCCPYRASLLTGQYPLTHGVFINDVELRPTGPSLAQAFAAGGYQTAYIGKWHVYGSPDGRYGRRAAFVPREKQLGFDYWKGFECTHDYWHSPYFFNDDPTPRLWEGYDAFAQSRDAADYISRHAADARPFLLTLSWGPPHFPLHTAPPEYRQRYEGRDLALRPNVPPELRNQALDHLRGYYAHIAALDDCLRIVLDAIRAAGIGDDTVLLFTADHGEMAKSQGLETKLFPFDESVVVPFLLRDPRLRSRRATSPALSLPVDAPDVTPTLLGLVGLPIPVTVEGRDWSPAIRGEKPIVGDEAALLLMPAEFTELRSNGMRAYRGLRTARHTYVRDALGPWLLFDNQRDPYQMRNLIGRPESRDLQQALEARLSARLQAMGDEFLDGRVYLERAGLTHYREVNCPQKRAWRYPWDALPRPDAPPAP